eukprot:g766.t1
MWRKDVLTALLSDGLPLSSSTSSDWPLSRKEYHRLCSTTALGQLDESKAKLKAKSSELTSLQRAKRREAMSLSRAVTHHKAHEERFKQIAEEEKKEIAEIKGKLVRGTIGRAADHLLASSRSMKVVAAAEARAFANHVVERAIRSVLTTAGKGAVTAAKTETRHRDHLHHFQRSVYRAQIQALRERETKLRADNAARREQAKQLQRAMTKAMQFNSELAQQQAAQNKEHIKSIEGLEKIVHEQHERLARAETKLRAAERNGVLVTARAVAGEGIASALVVASRSRWGEGTRPATAVARAFVERAVGAALAAAVTRAVVTEAAEEEKKAAVAEIKGKLVRSTVGRAADQMVSASRSRRAMVAANARAFVRHAMQAALRSALTAVGEVAAESKATAAAQAAKEAAEQAAQQAAAQAAAQAAQQAAEQATEQARAFALREGDRKIEARKAQAELRSKQAAQVAGLRWKLQASKQATTRQQQALRKIIEQNQRTTEKMRAQIQALEARAETQEAKAEAASAQAQQSQLRELQSVSSVVAADAVDGAVLQIETKQQQAEAEAEVAAEAAAKETARAAITAEQKEAKEVKEAEEAEEASKLSERTREAMERTARLALAKLQEADRDKAELLDLMRQQNSRFVQQIALLEGSRAGVEVRLNQAEEALAEKDEEIADLLELAGLQQPSS